MRTSGIPWKFCGMVATGDPGGGGLRYNGATAAATSIISVSDACLDRRNPDVSRYVATWDKAANPSHRGTLIVASALREGLAIFDVVGSSTDFEGWTQIQVQHVQSFDAFENGEQLAVQFLRTGDAATLSAVRELVREVSTSQVTQPLDTTRLDAMERELIATRDLVTQLQSALSLLVVEATRGTHG